MMYDRIFDLEFDEALRDLERESDPEDGDAVNRPEDEPDDWLDNCVTEEEWKRRNAIYSAEWREAQEAIKRWRDTRNTK